MNPISWGPDEVSAAAAVGGFLVALTVGIFAFVQVRQARREWRAANRPYVIVDFEFRRFLVQVAVKNISTTPARNVEVAFDKPLEAANERRKNINESSVFRRPIPMLAPGRTIHMTLDSGPDLFAKEGIALAYEVSVKYDDMEGRHYADPPFPLDLSPYRDTPIPGKGIQEIADSLNDLRQDVKKLTQGTPLRVKSSDYDREQRRDMREYAWATGRTVLKDSGFRRWVEWLVDRFLVRHGWR